MISNLGRAVRRYIRKQIPYRLLLRRRPISQQFGFDRGLPVDRYYIERFLREHSLDIRGLTLEIGDDAYTRQFGGEQVEIRKVLHVDPEQPADYHGDISRPDVLPDATFDCIVFTQTLHLIYDMQAALASLYKALKPEGVLLITVPGITPIARDQWGESWYWSLTPAALRHLCEDQFGTGQCDIRGYGNVAAAAAFLYGLAAHEVRASKLDDVDVAYPVIVGARVRRVIPHKSI